MYMQLINGIQEQILIERLKEGDETAFELIFRHYYPGLLIYASNLIQDDAEAEEIVQEFFFQLWKKHNQIKSVDSLKSYLFQSIRNRSLNFWRDKQVRQKYIDELKNLSNNNLAFNPDLYVASELQAKIDDTINNLPEKCREIFVLSRFKGFKNDEIAVSLSISKRTVESQISKALRILKSELKEYLGLLILLRII